MDVRRRYASELRKLLKSGEEALQAANPEYAGLTYNAELHAFRKPPRGWSGHPARIISGFLINPPFLAMSNSEIVAQVADWYAPYRPSESIMTRPLNQTSREAIQKLFDQHGLNIRVRSDDTLSKLKKAIQAGQRAEGGGEPAAAMVEVTDDFVSANGQPYRIDKSRRHPSIRVTVDGKRQYIRCDALQALLGNPG